MKKYVLCPGVGVPEPGAAPRSIGYRELASLYGVEIDDCAIYFPDKHLKCIHSNMIWLYPRRDGVYVVAGKTDPVSTP